MQPGSYIWMDMDYGANADTCCMFEHALFVAATVMSDASPVADTVCVGVGVAVAVAVAVAVYTDTHAHTHTHTHTHAHIHTYIDT